LVAHFFEKVILHQASCFYVKAGFYNIFDKSWRSLACRAIIISLPLLA